MATACPRCGRGDTSELDWGHRVCPGCRALLRSDSRICFISAGAAFAGFALQLAGMGLVTWPGWQLTLIRTGEALMGGGVIVVLFGRRLRLQSLGPYCTVCGYDVRTLPAGAPCPECGTNPADT